MLVCKQAVLLQGCVAGAGHGESRVQVRLSGLWEAATGVVLAVLVLCQLAVDLRKAVWQTGNHVFRSGSYLALRLV